MKSGPVALNERIEAIDMMRGFSLLGIFIINMLTFHTPLSYIDPFTYFSVPADKEAFRLIDIFIQTSFYPLFSMLFGYGLAIQFDRAQQRNQPFMPLAIRRLLGLLVFGVFHAFLIWYGDILITYALIGFLLIGMLRVAPGYLLGFGLILYTVPHAFFAAVTFYAAASGVPFYTGIQEVTASIEAYANGSFSAIFEQRFNDWYYGNNPMNYIILIVTILPFMMIGAAAAKWRLVEQVRRHYKLWLVLTVIGFSGGLALKSLPYTVEKNYGYAYIQDMFGGPLLAVGYAAVIALASQSAWVRKLLSPVTKAGRMSLTTYLTQSIVATMIFYSYGLGLYGQVDVTTGTYMALGIYALQLIFAELWLSKYRQGPAEWLWRRMTYGLKF